jgi:choloylglycine hydrolase
MIGMATVESGYPLYYEAVNEHGLGMAALRFARCAAYRPEVTGTAASFELIPWVLSQCATLEQARKRLREVQINDRAFSPLYPPTPLHWFLADRSGAVAVEPLAEGLRVWDDPVRVLTNAPPFARQAAHWTKFANASQSAETPNGLPGDWSSPSRFVRAAFAATHAPAAESDAARVATLLRLLATVTVPRGCVQTTAGEYHSTMYTCCYDTVGRTYHYTTATDPVVHSVPLGDPCGTTLRIYR